MHTRTMMTIWFVVLLLVGGALLAACRGETTPTAPATTAVVPTQVVATAVPTAEEALTTTAPTQAPVEPTKSPPEPTESPATEEVPTIDAEALLRARCVDCHSLSRTTGARHTQEQWQQIVTRMIRLGAVLNAEEETALVAYLAETYRP